MESPEMQARMEEERGQQQKLDNQYTASINKLLYPKQRTALKKMLGAPFDRSKMGMPGFGPGGRNNQAARKNGAANGKGATAKPKSEDDDEESASSDSSKPRRPRRQRRTPRQRKSLRDLRGGDDE